jgi:DNA-binding response OmpR family regulator
MALQITSDREVRVLVAEDDLAPAQRLVDFLTNNGFSVRFVRNGQELLNMLLNWRPDYIITDLMLPELNALSLLKQLREQDLLREGKIKVIVVSRHNNPANVRECLRMGAIDYLVQPYKYVDLLRRIVLHEQPKREVAPVADPGRGSARQDRYFLHLADLVLREANASTPVDDRLFNLCRMAAIPLEAVRCSITECDLEARHAWVHASSDDKSIRRLRLDLHKYPELVYVMTMQKLLALENLATDPTMQAIHERHKSISFNSLIAAPIVANEVPWGVLHLRLPNGRNFITDDEIRYAQIVAHAAAFVLSREPGEKQGAEKLLKAA